MKKKHTKLGLAFLFGLGLTTIHAQQAVMTVGGTASGSGGRATYSVGQTMYTTTASGTGSVAEGVQQPYEISIVTSLEENAGKELQLSTYPNPASDQLTLTTGDDPEQLSYQLFDMQGKLLAKILDMQEKLKKKKKINAKQTLIKMGSYAPGSYLIKISDGDATVKTFKIIKN